MGLTGADGAPRIRRHQGVMAGKANIKIANSVMAAQIGRVKKMASDPWDMIRL